MKTNPDFILRQIAGDNILVPCGTSAQNINGLINLNKTAAFIWKNIDTSKNPDELIQKVMNEFEVDKETASNDVNGLIRELIQVGMVLEN
ncbi:MAG: PqqD family protein [Lachnospiraceae bacterium]